MQSRIDTFKFDSASSIASQVSKGRVSAMEITEQHLARIKSLNSDLNAFITVSDNLARSQAEKIDKKFKNGETLGPLAGVPIAIKDNIVVRGVETTCASKILKGWTPPYNATVIDKLIEADAVIVGKSNMDEFAMGSSTEHSAFGPTKNPFDLDRVPGGSSGGSAAAVAANLVPIALGSDTGGSIRQPAAFCGVLGLKPTYGFVSRYGLVAFASSLDQIGPFAKTIEDMKLLMTVISGHDSNDSTSLNFETTPVLNPSKTDIKGLRVGIVKEFNEGLTSNIAVSLKNAIEKLQVAGAVIEEVSIPSVKFCLSAYYLIAPAEASSNLARFDGVRYGARENGDNVEQMMIATRTKGFGDEVKRRIMLGTYALSKGYYDAYYKSAQQVRTLVIREFSKVYSSVDILLSPTTPSTAFKIGEKLDDPMEMYLSDIMTIPTNLAGHPAINVPFGSDDSGLPIGLQIMAPALKDGKLLSIANFLLSQEGN